MHYGKIQEMTEKLICILSFFFKENLIGSSIIMRACEFKIDQSFCINILPKGAFFHVFAKFLEITKNLICILQLSMEKNMNDDGGITI